MLSSARAASRRLPSHARSYAVRPDSYSAISYRRKGDQPEKAPLANTTVSKTSAGITLATFDHHGPVSSLAVVMNAGSRYESPDAPGVAHFWKNSLVRTIPGDTIVRTVREAELRGDALYTAHTREQLILASDFLRDNLVDAVPVLIDNLFNKSYHAYEFLDSRPLVVQEAAASLADPVTKVLDALHQAAFRSGLGNSLFCTADAAKALKRADLQKFSSRNFTADRIAIVGHGVSHRDLEVLVEEALSNYAVPKTSDAKVTPSRFRGYELRFEGGPKAESHYAVAFPSLAFTDQKYAAALVLRALLDGSKRLKWGNPSGSAGLLAPIATARTSVTAFEAGYSDAGMIGFYVQGSNEDVKKVAAKSMSVLKGLAKDVPSEALARAKKIAAVDAESVWGRDRAIQDIGQRVLSTGKYFGMNELAETIKQVTAADVQKVAKEAVSAKPAVVAYGNLLKLPFLDEL